MFRSNCIVCDSSNLDVIIKLGNHPFADTFIHESRLSESEPIYPLECDLCQDCGQIQTRSMTDPILRYSGYEYSYTSSNSSFSRNHWNRYAIDISKQTNLNKNSFIVEIGSNDGYLIEQFMKLGFNVLGVDASPYMAELAKERDIKTIIGLFNLDIAKEIKSKHGRPELVVANNVFNHADMPVDFTNAVADLLKSDGTFVFESPYWYIGLENNQFDQIYHEHVSYFTVRSVLKMLEESGMVISAVQVVDYHGGSIRVFAKKLNSISDQCRSAKEMIEQECSAGTFDENKYKIFMKNILDQRNRFLEKVYGIKSRGGSIVAVGAAAKGNTFLNFYNLDHSVIDFVTDISPHKQGKYTPLTRIPICSDDIFANYDDVYALILSWNISDKLKKILYQINPKIKFLQIR